MHAFGSKANSLLALSCFGILLASSVAFSGCAGGGGAPTAEQKQEEPVKMEVVQIDQLSTLADKAADGQFMVAKVSIKNTTNQTIILRPTDFTLENITENDKERYSQPSEKTLGPQFAKAYGPKEKDKVLDVLPSNLYPRMELVRYFVFMVPSDAKPDGYQITYTSTTPSAKVSVPLDTPGTTIINDNRNEFQRSS
ncbi:MAG: hypothetical protein K0Q50_3080 [Vampirovibrio sp.]|jgi:hypothetical protein|nr:hypothetical protein [Vampirovibrio sp.]